jgi:hypothetical protein
MEIGDYIILPVSDNILEIKAENTDLKAKNSNLFGIAVGCIVIGTIAYAMYLHAKEKVKENGVVLVKV